MKTIILHSENELPLHTISNKDGLTFKFLENGAIYSIEHNDIMLNLYMGSPLEGAIGNIYLRIHGDENIAFTPLIGPESPSQIAFKEGSVIYHGVFDGIPYQVKFELTDKINAWYWTISTLNTTGNNCKIDLIYAQDAGIASKGTILNNEAYTSQYIDHTALQHPEFGTVLCSKQNLDQGNNSPWLALGSFSNITGYSTDGFQFYGCAYKSSNTPHSLENPTLPSTVSQFEFSLPALQTETFSLAPGDVQNCQFYGYYSDNHQATTTPADLNASSMAQTHAPALPESFIQLKDAITPTQSIFNNCSYFDAEDLSPTDLDNLFPQKHLHKEYKNDTLLSFFYNSNSSHHVVLKAKETLVERPHGHIFRSGNCIYPNEGTMSSTSYMNGVFNSHITVGNTSFNKLMNVVRNPLNIIKSGGQRIFVKINNQWQLLGLPSAYEMGLNSCRWIYKNADYSIMVRSWSIPDEPGIALDITETTGKGLEFMITNFLVLGVNEYDNRCIINWDASDSIVDLKPAESSMIRSQYPEASFAMVFNTSDMLHNVDGDTALYADGATRNTPLLTVSTKPTNYFKMMITADLFDPIACRDKAVYLKRTSPEYSICSEQAATFWNNLTCNAKFTDAVKSEDLTKLNTILPWFTHNAMIHFSVPHGLEQYSGAAWGVRDVCQGPIELFMSLQRYDMMKEILRNVFSHQYENGDWPQWYMFDRYSKIQSVESHGDIIIWPLKALCDYLEATNDMEFLEEQIPYTTEDLTETSYKDSLRSHINRIIKAIQEKCISGTSLISYGDGDWNDSLQPANKELKKHLVSCWTVELVYQTLKRYEIICNRTNQISVANNLHGFTANLQKEFNNKLIKDDVIAGFAYFEDSGDAKLMLHPSANETGIHYRLLPMIRGVISEIFDKDQAEQHQQLIKEHLLYPDGARLMDTPPEYLGGAQKFFKRAETASFFGREIGLHYVHAHIRYIESLAKMGMADELLKALLVIVPINLEECIPNAEIRQNNAYFSSSDANFADRYQAKTDYHKIKTGEVSVKGGWRIYSSGPGIYINQLISSMLGLRKQFDTLVFDPVLPQKLDGLSFEFQYNNKPVTYTFHVINSTHSPAKIVVNDYEMTDVLRVSNPYRDGGLMLKVSDFESKLTGDMNHVEIYL